ncbi:MAG: preprotein translocase subunit SecE [Clostridia bacterium]|nr:preprotein translocase subunit SecE [Clostridia bacterium]
MTKFMKSLSVILALILAMTLSFAVLAEESSDASSESAVEESSDSSAESSTVESSDASAESSTESSDASAESSDASSEASTESSTTAATSDSSTDNTNTTNPVAKKFPWARVITLIVIVVAIVVMIILAKTNTPLGIKIKKFFKEYASEIKKVSWCSPKDTLKATGVVLIFIIAAALVICLLDLAFMGIIELLTKIF